jgi:hypothetical protein
VDRLLEKGLNDILVVSILRSPGDVAQLQSLNFDPVQPRTSPFPSTLSDQSEAIVN